MNPRSALIFGVTGQDGAYLARLLLEKGYAVHGTSRDVGNARIDGLVALGISGKVVLHSASPSDFRSVFQVMQRVHPDEVYNLSGQTSVALSFQQPLDTMESIVTGTLNIIETLRLVTPRSRFYNAGSSESFGDTACKPAVETTAFRPRSPYGVAKAAAALQVANYREAYGLFACSGILFNHESPLRPERFVTRKICSAARRIADGSGEKLPLGNLHVSRDWGWAPEYVDAMWRMLQVPSPDDYVIATGRSVRLEDFVATAFAAVDLDWRDHVTFDQALVRPSDIAMSVGRPEKAERVLGWRAATCMPDIARLLVAAERDRAPS
jgi:GDPmannose 4,6-dehydratase